MYSKGFWLALLERAIKTFAQSLAALIVVNATGLTDIEWSSVLSTAGLTTLASVLTSIATNMATGSGPSVGAVEKVAAAPDEPAGPPDEGPAGEGPPVE